MELRRQEHVLCHYLDQLGLAGECWLIGSFNDSLIEALTTRFPDGALHTAPPDEPSTLNDCSLIILDSEASPLDEEIIQQLASFPTRPLIVLFGGPENLSASEQDRLRALGYQIPPSPPKGQPFLVIEHAELSHKKYFDVARYWETRYASGRDSGSGSHGRLARFKAQFLNDFVKQHNIKSVLELGCGDGAQLFLAEYPEYIGFDISPTAVDLCRRSFAHDHSKRFDIYHPNRFTPATVKVELGLSLDVIYHLSNDQVYHTYLAHLFSASSRFVIIYGNAEQGERPGVNESASYIRFRDFLTDIEHWHSKWTLISATPNRFPFSALNPMNTSFADFFVFEKQRDAKPATFSTSDLGHFAAKKLLNTLIISDENAKDNAKTLIDVNKKIDALEQKFKQLDNARQLQTKINELDAKYHEARKKLEALQKIVSTTKERNRELETQCYNLNEKYRDADEKYRGANEKHRNAAAKLSALRSSQTYRAGLYVKSASNSLLDAAKLPMRLWRLKAAPTNRKYLLERLRYIKWKAVVPLATRLGVPYEKVAYLALPRLRRRFVQSPPPQRLPASTSPIRLSENLAPELLRWLASHPRAAGAATILYADINLNVVDGSSVWLSSMASLLSSRAPCIIVAKVPVTLPIVLSNIRNPENVTILDPSAIPGMTQLGVEDAIRVVRALDDVVAGVRRVVVRGLDPATLLFSDRQFDGRGVVYLTDFYTVENGVRKTTPEQALKVRASAFHAAAVLIQTPEIGRELEHIAGPFNAIELPPMVPADMPSVQLRSAAGDDVIRIGYAGKINSCWGVIELLEWAESATRGGTQIELHIAANKISNGPEQGYERLRDEIRDRMQRTGVRHYTNLNREASIELMSRMDFVWCYRPARFEDTTLELSTKLVEMASLGARCICYPSSINRRTLGEHYPFFIRDQADFASIIGSHPWADADPELALRLLEHHGSEAISSRVGQQLIPAPNDERAQTILVAGHDMKFIDTLVSRTKARGSRVLRDVWDWGCSRHETTSLALCRDSDIVFCEWGLANAAWASHNLSPGKRLIVRIHAQEVRDRARRFGREIDPSKVDTFIFVSEMIRRKAIELWKWPAEKTIVIPNYVLDHEFIPGKRTDGSTIVLGILGIVPTLKRFDRALDLLAALAESGLDVRLEVKGHRPETLEFMHAPSRRGELAFYNTQYTRIDQDSRITGRVGFSPWGNDVAHWYKGLDVILSCSETESFHYALADGVLSGCLPVVWPWTGAKNVYDPDWVVTDEVQACERILGFLAKPEHDRNATLNENRALIVRRYGFDRITTDLLRVMYGNAHSTRHQPAAFRI